MKKAYMSYISSLLLFGLNGIVASFIPLSSYVIVLLRTLIGSVFLICIFAAGRNKTLFWKDRKSLVFLIISGSAMGASWMLLYEAYKLVGVSIATLSYYCGPVILMALAPLLFGEKFTAAKLVGFASVIAGMLCINGASLLSEGISPGLLCGILAAFMYCVMVVFNKKASGITGINNAMCQLIVACVVVGAFTLINDPGGIQITRGSIVPIVILGIVNTGAGCYLYFSSIQTLSAQSVSIIGYLEPLAALVFSAAFLRERLTAIQLIGAALVLGGAAFGELYRSRRN